MTYLRQPELKELREQHAAQENKQEVSELGIVAVRIPPSSDHSCEDGPREVSTGNHHGQEHHEQQQCCATYYDIGNGPGEKEGIQAEDEVERQVDQAQKTTPELENV
ncbi:MAG: hypothetical protein ACD_55C00098G0001 [uncultured bacterium]|nr:MAG: hypothetical protein ACD_55C00098G0001 [uncultured bacterium]